MLEWLNNMTMAAADPLLNWLLHLPPDLALIIVAVGTGSIITFSRLFTTNQDLLGRCDSDKKRLTELIREARTRKDREAVKRHRATMNMIGIMAIKQEGRPLLAALIPIALLGSWCFQRMAFIPPRGGETVQVIAYFPLSAIGELTHMAPQKGVREVSNSGQDEKSRWIREIVGDVDPKTQKAVGGAATWSIRADARAEPYKLEIRHKEHTVEKELLVDCKVYSPETRFYDDGGAVSCVELSMRPVKLFGILPGIGFLLIPPWLMAYFLIAIPSVSLIRKMVKIY